jgi:hypothetical protein
VLWYQPNGRLFFAVGKPRLAVVDSFVFQTNGLPRGRWRAVLRAGKVTVKQITFRVG